MIFDDPLKALDSKTALKILSKTISKTLKGKTRIMTSHVISDGKYADRVIVLKDGMIKYNGIYDNQQISDLLNYEEKSEKNEQKNNLDNQIDLIEEKEILSIKSSMVDNLSL